MGCGVLRRIRPDAVEMKRMFVRPESQGQVLAVLSFCHLDYPCVDLDLGIRELRKRSTGMSRKLLLQDKEFA